MILPLYRCIKAIHCWNVCNCAFPSFCSVRSAVGVRLVLAVVVVVLWVVAPLQALSKKRQSKTALSNIVRKRRQNEVCIRRCVLFITLILHACFPGTGCRTGLPSFFSSCGAVEVQWMDLAI